MTTGHKTRVEWDEANIRYTVTCDSCDLSVTGKTYADLKPTADAHEQGAARSIEGAEGDVSANAAAEGAKRHGWRRTGAERSSGGDPNCG